MRNNERRLGNAAQSPALVPTHTEPAYVVPTEFVELPSRGAFYSEDHPLYGEETVEIKYMTAKEEDILSSSALINKGLVIDRLLENILVLDIDPTTLLIGDRNAIMIAARISAYGHGYHAEVTCHNCHRRSSYIFDLKKTNLTENCFNKSFLKEEGVTLNKETNTFDVVLPKSEVKISVKLFDGADEKLMNDEIDDASIVTSVLSNFIVSVADNTEESFVQNFINNMPAADSKHIRNLYPKLAPNVDLKQQHLCSNCTHEEEMEVPLSAEFFWPK